MFAVSVVGDNVKRLRALRGWSLRQLEQRAGVSYAHIHELEKGKTANPTQETLTRLAKAFGVAPDVLSQSPDSGAEGDDMIPTELLDAQINLSRIGELDEEEYKMLLQTIAERRRKVERDHRGE